MAELPRGSRGTGRDRDLAPLRLRRPAYPRHGHLLPRLRRDGGAFLAAEPSAAVDQRGGMARHRGGRRAAGQPPRSHSRRPLRRGQPGRRRRSARRRRHRQLELPATAAGRASARRPPSASLRRRSRQGSGRALVGIGRSHPGAVRGWPRAREPPRPVARPAAALQRDECRAAGALLPGLPGGAARQRRTFRAAHLPADARTL